MKLYLFCNFIENQTYFIKTDTAVEGGRERKRALDEKENEINKDYVSISSFYLWARLQKSWVNFTKRKEIYATFPRVMRLQEMRFSPEREPNNGISSTSLRAADGMNNTRRTVVFWTHYWLETLPVAVVLELLLPVKTSNKWEVIQ